MGTRAILPLVLLLLAPAAASPAFPEEPPFPPGTSSRTLEGLRCSVVMPESFDPAKERSLLVILHGAGGTETGMAGSLAHLAADDFVVLAPKSKAETWAPADLEAVRRIVADLRKRLHVGEGRLHAAGFSNGGWNLAPVVFDEDQKYASACWIAAGYNGGSVPKYARKSMGVIALAGSEDPNRSAAEKTPDLLEDKVRTAESRIQEGKGHEWPDGLMPYYRWWLLVMEGRFTPGECRPFDWLEDPATATARMAERKTGGFAYFYSKDQGADPVAKTFQNETLRDRAVQHFGRQLVAWKAERTERAEGFLREKLRETPAVVVYDHDGKAVKSLQGKISAQALAAAFRAVAPDKKPPKK